MGTNLLRSILQRLRSNLALVVIGCCVVFVFLMMAGLISISLLTQKWSQANSLAAITSALATIVLVGLTGWYSWETRRMVEQEIVMREREKESKRNQVRRALLGELYGAEYFFRMFKDSRPNFKHDVADQLTEIARTNVYDDATIEIGQLSEDEISLVSSYYNLLNSIHFNIQLVVANMQDNPSSLPPDLTTVSRSSIVHLNSLWRNTVLQLESELPEDPPTERRTLVELKELDNSNVED